MADRDKRPSEFGGVPGVVQPEPHELTPAEEARLERMAPADDISADAASVLAAKRASGEYESSAS